MRERGAEQTRRPQRGEGRRALGCARVPPPSALARPATAAGTAAAAEPRRRCIHGRCRCPVRGRAD
eukprot:1353446-Pyramimonas_sp.AAC.1